MGMDVIERTGASNAAYRKARNVLVHSQEDQNGQYPHSYADLVRTNRDVEEAFLAAQSECPEEALVDSDISFMFHRRLIELCREALYMEETHDDATASPAGQAVMSSLDAGRLVTHDGKKKNQLRNYLVYDCRGFQWIKKKVNEECQDLSFEECKRHLMDTCGENKRASLKRCIDWAMREKVVGLQTLGQYLHEFNSSALKYRDGRSVSQGALVVVLNSRLWGDLVNYLLARESGLQLLRCDEVTSKVVRRAYTQGSDLPDIGPLFAQFCSAVESS